MSLYEPLPQADLSPKLPSGGTLSWQHLEDYGHLFVWVFWRPHSLTHYLKQHGAVETDVGLASVQSYPPQVSYHKVVERLYLLAFCLTQLLVAFIGAGYWMIWAIFRLSDGLPMLPIGLLFSALVAGAFIVTITHVIIRGINDWFFSSYNRTDVAVAAMVILGLLFGITASVFFLDSFRGDFLFRIALLSSCAGATVGLIISTLTYYLKNESSQKSLIFNGLTSFVVIIVGTLLSGLITRSLSVMIIALFFTTASFVVTALRIDDWLIGRFLRGQALAQRDLRKLPRVTPIPLLGLRIELEDWLEWDWKKGLENIRTIREYTRQDPLTSMAICQLLKESSEENDNQIVSKVEQLQAIFSDLDLRLFSPGLSGDSSIRNFTRQAVGQLTQPSTQKKINKTRKEERLKHRQKRWTRARQRQKLAGKYPDNTPADAAIAGFSFLKLNYPEKAATAFRKVEHDDLGKEMGAISQGLETLWFAEKLPDKLPLNLPKRPTEVRHADTWKAFGHFQDIVRYVWILNRSRDGDNYALVCQLINTKLMQLKNGIPKSVEGKLLEHIVADWETELGHLIDTVERYEKVKKIENPYIFAEPLHAQSKGLLHGRDQHLNQIKAAWKVGNFQPLLICGQRHMGKTSLIRCADAQFSKSIRMAYVNLRQLNIKATPNHLFLAICDAVNELYIHPSPTRDELFAAPYREFQKYIHQCASRLGSIGLVIVLDELDHFAKDAERSGILNQSIQQLWTLAQLDSNLGVILITTRNPSQLVSDDEHNLLTSSVHPVEVSYLSRDEVARLLRNPNPTFLPYCTDQALDRIYFWTAGQPYLTQLLAYHLVEHYNVQVEELGGLRDPLFTVEDIDQTVRRSDFNRQCEQYFRDIVEEAKDVDESAIKILDVLAERRMGFSSDELEASLMNPVDSEILEQLHQHRIIQNQNGRWQIVVELLRWWLKARNQVKINSKV